MIRILHVIGCMDVGGAETFTMNVFRLLDRSKVQFDFVEHTDSRSFFDDEIERLGGRIFRCPCFSPSNIIIYSRWWDTFFRVNQGAYVYIHGHIGRSANVYLRFAKKHGLPTIAHSHNIYSNNGVIERTIAFIKYITLSKPTVKYSDVLFACSFEAGVSRYGKSFSKRYNLSSFVIKNGIYANNYKFDQQVRDSLRCDWNATDKFIIGHIGRFSEQKNQLHLLKTFMRLKGKYPESALVFVGDGEMFKEIMNETNAMSLSRDVIFLGIRQDVHRILSAFDVFVFPSKYEGFGIALLEAQAAGLPCVVSDAIVKEAIITEVSVLPLTAPVTQWADKILEYRGYPRKDQSHIISEHGYDIEDTVRKLTDFYSTQQGKDE